MLRSEKVLKDYVKAIPGTMIVIASIKAYCMKRAYDRTSAAYRRIRKRRETGHMDYANESGRIVRKQKRRALWVGTDAGQDRSGLLQGLARVAEVVEFINEVGEYGQLRAIGPLAIQEREANGRTLLKYIENYREKGNPIEVIVGQLWNYRMDNRALDHARKYGIRVVNIGMDDRHAYWGRRMPNGEWGGTRGLVGHVDLVCTAAPECVEWFSLEGCRAIFLPEASDPNFFAPRSDVAKVCDVCFVGAAYGIRQEIVAALEQSGLTVSAYGKGWPRGPISTEEVPELFARSKIILGVGTIGYCTDLFALKMRDFDGPMSGSLYLTTGNPDLLALYDVGSEIVTYRNVRECVELAKYYVRHDVEREAIADAGRRRAERDHTWQRRFECVLGTLEQINCRQEKRDR